MNQNCQWCGKSYDEHVDYIASDQPTPKVPCLMLKSGFYPPLTVPVEPSKDYIMDVGMMVDEVFPFIDKLNASDSVKAILKVKVIEAGQWLSDHHIFGF